MSAYKFRILIDTDSSEEVFRDIVISPDSNFEEFYREIIKSFEFSGEQLASFYMSNDDWDKGHEIVLFEMGYNEQDEAPSIMAETKLLDHIEDKGQKLILVYDFLKMWCFLIELIDITEEKITLPTVTLAIGNPPSENEREEAASGLDGALPADFGNDLDDIFSEFDEDDDEEDFGSFENIDDYDF